MSYCGSISCEPLDTDVNPKFAPNIKRGKSWYGNKNDYSFILLHKIIRVMLQEPGMTQTRLYSHRRWLKMAKGWKFWIKEVEGLYYPCSENKGADQLCGYRAADLRLCFHICKKQVF